MKPKAFVFPLVSLLAAAAWLVPQQRSVSAIRAQNESLRQQLAQQVAITDAGNPSSSSTQAKREPKDKEPIDWKKIASRIGTGGSGDIREQIRFQQQLKELSADEILAALDEIKTLDLSPAQFDQLEMMLASQLSQRDPKLTLERFIDRVGSSRGQLEWILGSSLAAWVKKDGSAATTWFDQQIAAGKFQDKALDGKNRVRVHFEAALMGVLISADPAAATDRIAALPMNQRGDVLQSLQFREFKDKEQETFAAITRELLPEKDQADVLAQPTALLLNQGGYAKVDDYLDRIAANPRERTEVVDRVGFTKSSTIGNQRKITRGDLDEFREWAATQSPATLNHSTGKLLAQSSQYERSGNFTEIAAIAVDYHESSGNDEVLGTFLESWSARANKEQSRVLAEKISDPTRREKILIQLK